MIDTSTTWEDSGYDCQHCGAQIMKRTDYETGHPAQSCYQGERGCQWSLDGELIRVGNHPDCRRAQRRGSGPVERYFIPLWVWGVTGGLFLLVALRFGGFAALRFLVPAVLTLVALFYAYRVGKQQQWW